MTLRHLALHVAVLVLHRTAEQRLVGIEQLAQTLLRTPDELPHQFRLRQGAGLQRVGGEEAVLHAEEWRFGFFRHAPGDQRQVCGFLSVAREQHAPAAIGNAHHVIMSGVNI